MNVFDLDQPVFEFSTTNEDAVWTLRHAVEGVQIFGGIGSGKTSGSARMLALKYLKKGMGGLVLTVKPDEKLAWIEYCRLTNRLNDLIVIEPKGEYRFNFLEYESAHTALNEAITDNIVQVLKTVIRAGEQQSNKGDDPFWETALDMLIFNLIDLCRMAYGTLSVQTMYDIVQSMPKNEEAAKRQEKDDDGDKVKPFDRAYDAAHAKVMVQVNSWWTSLSKTQQKIYDADEELYDNVLLETLPDVRLLKFLHEFFFESFKNLSSKTRSIVEFTFSGFLFRLLRDPVYSMFCKGTSNITPEDSLKGKIILVNLPVKIYHKVGRDCQILFKYIWQRAMERRLVTATSRPVFLWADEAQNFLHEHDAEYQATARSSRISTVYITQNLPNYYASMGGEKAEYRVKSFLGTLGTKIFHANADIETNKYSSELIGDEISEDISQSITATDRITTGASRSWKLNRRIRPEEFVNLSTGGPKNEHKVEGFMHRQGDCIFNNKSFRKMTFNQLFIP